MLAPMAQCHGPIVLVFLRNPPGSVSVVAEDAGRQAAVVGPNAHGTAQGLALLHKRGKCLQAMSSRSVLPFVIAVYAYTYMIE